MAGSDRRAISRADLGAWVLRCNPAKWDLAGFLAAGERHINSCSVVQNYRSEMMRPADPAIFWVSGSHRVLRRGIWGVGRVVQGIREEPAGVNPATGDRWLDHAARRSVSNAVFVDIPLWDEGVFDAELRAAGIDDLEVQRQPQGSNPSWVSLEQWGRLQNVLPPSGA